MSFLPEYPRVYAENHRVIIEYFVGDRIIWGDEKSIDTAARVADELEKELRILHYLNSEIEKTLTKSSEAVQHLISKEKSKHLIEEALRQIIRQL